MEQGTLLVQVFVISMQLTAIVGTCLVVYGFNMKVVLSGGLCGGHRHALQQVQEVGLSACARMCAQDALHH